MFVVKVMSIVVSDYSSMVIWENSRIDIGHTVFDNFTIFFPHFELYQSASLFLWNYITFIYDFDISRAHPLIIADYRISGKL